MENIKSNKTSEIVNNLNNSEVINLFGILLAIVANLRLIIFGSILAGLIALSYAFTIVPTYTAKTLLIPPGQNSGASGGAMSLLGQMGALTGGLLGAKAPVDLYIAYLDSNSLKDLMITRFNLIERFSSKNIDQARNALTDRSRVIVDKRSGLIKIEVTDADPKFAAELANGYVWALSHLLGKFTLEEAKAKRELLDQQINDALGKTYRSSIVREAIIQAILRDYEAAWLDERKNSAHIQQVDIAETPLRKSHPQKALIAITTTLVTGLFLIMYALIKSFLVNTNFKSDSSSILKALIRLLENQLLFKSPK